MWTCPCHFQYGNKSKTAREIKWKIGRLSVTVLATLRVSQKKKKSISYPSRFLTYLPVYLWKIFFKHWKFFSWIYIQHFGIMFKQTSVCVCVCVCIHTSLELVSLWDRQFQGTDYFLIIYQAKMHWIRMELPCRVPLFISTLFTLVTCIYVCLCMCHYMCVCVCVCVCVWLKLIGHLLMNILR